MCGLVAVITKNRSGFNSDQRDAFDMMLWIDTFRGDDSTGAFVVNTLGNVSIAKEASYAPKFMYEDEYLALRTKVYKDGWAMVGHNRKATRGDVTDENAHPFVVDDNIVLVHNGSYNGDHKGLKDVAVDSEAIAHAISEGETVEAALREVNAAYALIWYNQEEKSLNFIRNNMRPLWMMESHSGFFFASEECFLQMVKSKFKMQLVKEPVELQAFDHHKFELLEHSMKHTVKALDCSYWKHHTSTTTYTHSTVQEPPFRHTGFGGQCGYDYENDGCDEWGEVDVTPAPPPSKVVDLVPYDKPLQTRIMEALYPKCRTITHSKWMDLRKELPDGTRIKVTVNDLTEADDNPKTKNFLLIGQPLQDQNLYVTFPMNDKTIDAAIAATNDSVFEVTVNGFSWKRTEGFDTKKKMDDWQGVAIINASNPVPIYTTDMSKHAH